jgi:hypothetical protein
LSRLERLSRLADFERVITSLETRLNATLTRLRSRLDHLNKQLTARLNHFSSRLANS